MGKLGLKDKEKNNDNKLRTEKGPGKTKHLQ